MYSQGMPMSTKPGGVKKLFLFSICAAAACVAACVPPGNSVKEDAGTSTTNAVNTAQNFRPSANVMTVPFEDNFDRVPTPLIIPSASASASASTPVSASASASSLPAISLAPTATRELPVAGEDLGPNWHQAQTGAWHIENGRLCGRHAQNHGVWLNKILPVNARIEFDAIADTNEGDLKAEIWGDGQSHATAMSYTNATSYLAILGGWKNKFHVLARINEHGNDRKEIKVDPESDDPKEKPVVAGQIYHFKIERTDGKVVHLSVNGEQYLTYDDPSPLVGMGHDHFGFNDWEVKVCFDNVKVVPLP